MRDDITLLYHRGMRALIDLPAPDLAALDAIARRNKRSRAAEVRAAVRAHIAATSSTDWIARGAGAWSQRTDIGDSVEWQRRERAGWTRPWDDDYEAVKAEFPDLFDADDDRERALYLAAQNPTRPPADDR